MTTKEIDLPYGKMCRSSRVAFPSCNRNLPLFEFKRKRPLLKGEKDDPNMYGPRCLDCVYQNLLDKDKETPLDVKVAKCVKRVNDRSRYRDLPGILTVKEATEQFLAQKGLCSNCGVKLRFTPASKHALRSVQEKSIYFQPEELDDHARNMASIDRLLTGPRRAYKRNFDWKCVSCNRGKGDQFDTCFTYWQQHGHLLEENQALRQSLEDCKQRTVDIDLD